MTPIRRIATAAILTLLLLPLACATIAGPAPNRFSDSTPLVTTGDQSTALLLLSPAPDSVSIGARFSAGSILFPVPARGWLYPAADYTALVRAAAKPKPSYAPVDGVTVKVGP